MIQSVGTPAQEHVGSKAQQASGKSLSFEEARRQLETLSNKTLLSDVERLNQRECRLKVLVLLYLSEIDRRQLFLPLGYSSLFDFCTMHLGYTRATAARRIRAARAGVRYPEALEMLRSGEINITTLSLISDILTPGNHRKLLSEIRHKSTRQVELLVSRHRPLPAIPDTVRPVCVMRRVEDRPGECGGGAMTNPGGFGGADGNPGAGINGQNLSSTEDTGSRKCNKISSSAETNSEIRGGLLLNARSLSGSVAGSSAETTPADRGQAAGDVSSSAETTIIEQRFKIGFTVNPEFMIKYNKIKSLLSGAHPEGIVFETLFDILMTEYLEKHDPEKRRARRIERRDKRGGAGRDDSSNEAGGRRSESRHIPAATRDIVYARDKGRCSFIGANGTRCNSTWDLEIDHIVPVARGGDNSPGNLRLLCRTHNMHQAERTYGGEFMKNRIIKR